MESFNNGLINIGGDPNDEFYRYKMPPIKTQVTGRGNGIHTHLINIDDVANAIGHPEDIIMKYIAYELASNLNQKNKSLAGKHDTEVQEKILDYVNNLVLCPKCNNPETIYEVEGKKKRMKLFSKCASCGFRCEIVAAGTEKEGIKVIKGKNSTKIMNNIIKYVQDNPVSLETKEKKEYLKEMNVIDDQSDIFG
jgi:translation initiation factor 2 beta subunit (eIF-2beta)/eIF-5